MQYFCWLKSVAITFSHYCYLAHMTVVAESVYLVVGSLMGNRVIEFLEHNSLVKALFNTQISQFIKVLMSFGTDCKMIFGAFQVM
jgi:hypothetical protein